MEAMNEEEGQSPFLENSAEDDGEHSVLGLLGV